jgi:CubicO group peptidase (beta-lactamase class C family)
MIRSNLRRTLLLTLLAIAGSANAATAASATRDSQLDSVFGKWTGLTPGCVAGASIAGQAPLVRAYGMADLEHDIKNGADTIFEAGSVSKQFTAAAVLLLAHDGSLSLDDPVRKFIPELPDYGAPLTLRHMLTHTGGLRDWGSVMYVAGWPRGTRVYTHAHVLDIVSRQRALNFAPGTRWSYSNTGYNLAAIVVERVSGMPFQDFTRRRIFEPLGMTRTSWRDNHARVVKGRAVAYVASPQGFTQQMPFENVYGNGGLLTTVGDLLKWNENFSAPRVGDAAFVAGLQERARLNDGRTLGYALGLMHMEHRGAPEVSHGGVTGGYSSFLARYPAQQLSIAVLCNVLQMTDDSAHAVADLYLPVAPLPSPQSEWTERQLAAYPGIYRSADTGLYLNVIRDQSALRLGSGAMLTPRGRSRLGIGNRTTLEIRDDGTARLEDVFGGWDILERVAASSPGVQELQRLTGKYSSQDAAMTVTVALNNDKLVMHRGVDTLELAPIYVDAFSFPGGSITFKRNSAGAPTLFTLSVDRLWNLPFVREEAQ